LCLGFGVVADAGNVRLTEAVDLRRADQSVALAAPDLSKIREKPIQLSRFGS